MGSEMCIRDRPLWITAADDTTQHIFFDDNIHDKPVRAHLSSAQCAQFPSSPSRAPHGDGNCLQDDSIVAVRARLSNADRYHSVSGEATRQLEGVLLVKVSPVAALLDENYFMRQIERCETNFAHMKEDGRLQLLLLDQSAGEHGDTAVQPRTT